MEGEFTETQRMPWGWVAGLLAFCGVVFFGAMWLADEAMGEGKPLPYQLLGTALFMLLVATLLLSIRLSTRIGKEGIEYRYYPFQWKVRHVSWEEVQAVRVRKAEPFLEFGGWGWRYSWDLTTLVLTTHGRYGLEVKRRKGKTLFIGTQEPDHANHVLRALGKLPKGEAG